MNQDRLLSELNDSELLDTVLPSTLEHSDYTLYGSYPNRVKEKLDALQEREDGRLTPELALTVITRDETLVAAMQAYRPFPFWLESLLIGLHSGHYKLTGGQIRNPTWAKDRDIVGIFNKLVSMGFRKGKIYQKLAEHLTVNGWNTTIANHNNHNSEGAETVRHHIRTMTKSTK